MHPPQGGEAPPPQDAAQRRAEHGVEMPCTPTGSAFGSPSSAPLAGGYAAGARDANAVTNQGAADGKRSRSSWEGQWIPELQLHNMEAQDGGSASATSLGVCVDADRPVKKPRARPGTQVARKCPHDRRKSRCKECGGVEICEHDRVRSRCVRECVHVSCVYLSCMVTVQRLGSMYCMYTKD